jgi:L-amino acid N-acyltransferase YncA
MIIRQATIEDAHAITEIYNWYITNTVISFEITPVTLEEMTKRMKEKLEHYDWLVGEIDNEIVGYAYYGTFRPREAYHHSVEASIYLVQGCTGRGFGKALYESLIDSAKKHGFREMVGVITLPNPASIALHEALGFKLVGVNTNIGYKFGRYIDVGMWQLSLGQ